jgi:hypothetical protein
MTLVIVPAALALLIIIESVLVFFNVEAYYRFLPKIKTHDYNLGRDHMEILRRLSGKTLDTFHSSYKINHKKKTCYIKIPLEGRFPIPFFIGITRYTREKDQIHFLYTVKAKLTPPLSIVLAVAGMIYLLTIESTPKITDTGIGILVAILAVVGGIGYSIWKDLENIEMAFFWAMEDIRMEFDIKQEKTGDT